jgi:hypothetical protein
MDHPPGPDMCIMWVGQDALVERSLVPQMGLILGNEFVMPIHSQTLNRLHSEPLSIPNIPSSIPYHFNDISSSSHFGITGLVSQPSR